MLLSILDLLPVGDTIRPQNWFISLICGLILLVLGQYVLIYFLEMLIFFYFLFTIGE